MHRAGRTSGSRDPRPIAVTFLALNFLFTAPAFPASLLLYTHPGGGYSVKNVGTVVYDFERNLVVLGKACDLKNMKGVYEPLPPSLTNSQRFVLAKYSREPGNRLLFVREVGEAHSFRYLNLTADRSGNIYGAGSVAYTRRIIDGPNAVEFELDGKDDCLLVKWDASGRLVWTRKYGGPGLEEAHSVAVDVRGDLFLAGSFQGELVFKSAKREFLFRTHPNQYDLFLTKLHQDGSVVWARQLTGADSTLPAFVETDVAGNCLLTSGFEGTVSVEGGGSPLLLTSRGGWDLLLAKFSGNGKLLWARSDGGPANDYGSRLAVDERGWAFVHGRYGSGAVFGEGPAAVNMLARDHADMMIACYDDQGRFMGVTRTGGSGVNMDPQIITIFDAAGNRYVVAEDSEVPRSASSLTATTTTTRAPTQPSGSSGVPSTAGDRAFTAVTRAHDRSIRISLHPDAVVERYIVEASEDLEQWTVLSTNEVTAGQVIITDPAAANLPMRFYRVLPQR